MLTPHYKALIHKDTYQPMLLSFITPTYTSKSWTPIHIHVLKYLIETWLYHFVWHPQTRELFQKNWEKINTNNAKYRLRLQKSENTNNLIQMKLTTPSERTNPQTTILNCWLLPQMPHTNSNIYSQQDLSYAIQEALFCAYILINRFYDSNPTIVKNYIKNITTIISRHEWQSLTNLITQINDPDSTIHSKLEDLLLLSLNKNVNWINHLQTNEILQLHQEWPNLPLSKLNPIIQETSSTIRLFKDPDENPTIPKSSIGKALRALTYITYLKDWYEQTQILLNEKYAKNAIIKYSYFLPLQPNQTPTNIIFKRDILRIYGTTIRIIISTNNAEALANNIYNPQWLTQNTNMHQTLESLWITRQLHEELIKTTKSPSLTLPLPTYYKNLSYIQGQQLTEFIKTHDWKQTPWQLEHKGLQYQWPQTYQADQVYLSLLKGLQLGHYATKLYPIINWQYDPKTIQKQHILQKTTKVWWTISGQIILPQQDKPTLEKWVTKKVPILIGQLTKEHPNKVTWQNTKEQAYNLTDLLNEVEQDEKTQNTNILQDLQYIENSDI